MTAEADPNSKDRCCGGLKYCQHYGFTVEIAIVSSSPSYLKIVWCCLCLSLAAAERTALRHDLPNKQYCATWCALISNILTSTRAYQTQVWNPGSDLGCNQGLEPKFSCTSNGGYLGGLHALGLVFFQASCLSESPCFRLASRSCAGCLRMQWLWRTCGCGEPL